MHTSRWLSRVVLTLIVIVCTGHTLFGPGKGSYCCRSFGTCLRATAGISGTSAPSSSSSSSLSFPPWCEYPLRCVRRSPLSPGAAWGITGGAPREDTIGRTLSATLPEPSEDAASSPPPFVPDTRNTGTCCVVTVLCPPRLCRGIVDCCPTAAAAAASPTPPPLACSSSSEASSPGRGAKPFAWAYPSAAVAGRPAPSGPLSVPPRTPLVSCPADAALCAANFALYVCPSIA